MTVSPKRAGGHSAKKGENMKKKKEKDLYLSLMKKSRERSLMPPVRTFESKKKYKRNRSKKELRKEIQE